MFYLSYFVLFCFVLFFSNLRGDQQRQRGIVTGLCLSYYDSFPVLFIIFVVFRLVLLNLRGEYTPETHTHIHTHTHTHTYTHIHIHIHIYIYRICYLTALELQRLQHTSNKVCAFASLFYSPSLSSSLFFSLLLSISLSFSSSSLSLLLSISRSLSLLYAYVLCMYVCKYVCV